jgi:plastocyanin
VNRLLIASFVALVLLAGCSSSPPEVSMTDEQTFDPETITVSVGETVTFTNKSSASHTVTAYEDDIPEGADYFSSGDFSSEQEARDSVADALVNADATFEVTLDEPGTYKYFCIPHESQGMSGTIEVKG